MYDYLIFDGQYFLMRGFHLHKSRSVETSTVTLGSTVYSTLKNTLTWSQLFKSIFYSMVKFHRDFHKGNKMIMVFDSGPYYKSKLVGHYKSNRSYINESDVEKAKDDPLTYLRLKYEWDLEVLKSYTKKMILEYFPKLGIDTVIHKGYEADDLAKLLASKISKSGKTSLLISSDSDWKYLIDENSTYSNPRGNLFHYDKMMEELGTLKDSGLSLYKYKAFMDSLYGSHNDLLPTVDKSLKLNNVDLLTKLLDQNYSDLLHESLFKAQLDSFDIWNFPEYDLVIEKLKDARLKSPDFLTVDQFSELNSKFNLGITSNYYNSFINRFTND